MATTQTRAIVTYPPGPDSPKAHWKLESVTADAPGPDELLVEMIATGLCHSDLTLAKRLTATSPPQVLGHEGTSALRSPQRAADSPPRCRPCPRSWLGDQPIQARRPGAVFVRGVRALRGVRPRPSRAVSVVVCAERGPAAGALHP